MDTLLMGVFAAWLVRQSAAVCALRQNTESLRLLLWILVSGLGVISMAGYPHLSDFMALFGYSWIAVTYLVLLLVCLFEEKGVVATMCRSHCLRQLGAISFGVYLFHQIVSGLCHGFLLGRPPQMRNFSGVAVTCLALAVTIILARISYLYFEKPIIDYGHRFSYRPDKTVPRQNVSGAAAPQPATTNLPEVKHIGPAASPAPARS
jgi:peptidoglycan/LPS O-acetylase OafA/YrhL